MNSHEQLIADAHNVKDSIEDIVEHICDEYMLSGEKVWVMISALAHTKLDEFPLEDDT